MSDPLNIVLADPQKRDRLRVCLDRHIQRGDLDDCWMWHGATGNGGYGRLGAGKGIQVRAHRAIWALENGPISPSLEVCHRCDNPPCCNPAHLFLGTHRANMSDMKEKGRHAPPPHYAGERHSRATLTEERVREIRCAMPLRYGDLSRFARKFGVSPNAIHAVVTNKVWRHVSS